VEGVRKSAGGLNLNVTKVLKTVQELMPAFRGLNFQGGIDGLTKIVEKAQGLRFSLDNMRSLANKVFNPEGAVELAAKLKVLGGSFAAMADPFSLMLKGQTDAAGLMDDVMKTMSGLAIKGKEGIFTIPPVQQALIREFAEATGENADNMIQGSIQMAKQADIMSRINPMAGVTEADRKMIANMAEMKDGKYMVKVDVKGMEVAVDNLNRSQIEAIKSRQEEESIASRNRMNIIEQFQNIYQIFLTALTPVFQKISDVMTKPNGFMSTLLSKATDFGKWLAEKLDGIFSGDTLNKLFDTLTTLINGVVGILKGDKSITEKLIEVVTTVLKAAVTTILPMIGEVINKSGAGSAVRTSATVMGGLGGAGAGILAGSAIGFLAGGPVGAAIGAIIGGIVGGAGGAGAGYGLSSSIIPSSPATSAPVQRDAIVSSDGKVTPYSKGDLAMLIDQQSLKKQGMTPSRDILSQVKTYHKESFVPMNAGGGGGSNVPQKVSFDISGTLKIEGERESAYLTSADLKNIGIQKLAYLIMNESDRYKNHQTSKRLQSEIIPPLHT
jgi:hypothetical protein